MSSDKAIQKPRISVVVLNYNGAAWLPRFFETLELQTVFKETEVIVVDNASTDNSDQIVEKWLRRLGRGRYVKNEANLYFCKGNNVGAALATGEFLFFLNFDLWLEPDCLEKLYEEVKSANADAATPIVLDYSDNTFQNCGSPGFDIFGMTTHMGPQSGTRNAFVACGCSLLVRTETFRKVGGFPEKFLMYGEETDLCWRVWIAGGRVITVPKARLHHRGAVAVNPEGHTSIVEARTSETKRFLANRNGILLLMKNAQHILLLLLISHLFLLFLEALASLVLVRRWSYVRKSYVAAIVEAFQMLDYVRESRQKIQHFRQRGDFWILRFFRLRPSRWDEVKRLLKFGVPKVEVK